MSPGISDMLIRRLFYPFGSPGRFSILLPYSARFTAHTPTQRRQPLGRRHPMRLPAVRWVAQVRWCLGRWRPSTTCPGFSIKPCPPRTYRKPQYIVTFLLLTAPKHPSSNTHHHGLVSERSYFHCWSRAPSLSCDPCAGQYVWGYHVGHVWRSHVSSSCPLALASVFNEEYGAGCTVSLCTKAIDTCISLTTSETQRTSRPW